MNIKKIKMKIKKYLINFVLKNKEMKIKIKKLELIKNLMLPKCIQIFSNLIKNIKI